MALHLFLGVRLPDQPYFRVPVYDVDCKKSVNQLKLEIETKLKQSKEALEFIYCGKVLNDDLTLEDQNIRNGSTIHVLQKRKQPVVRDMTVSEAEIEEAHRDYNSILDQEMFCTYPILPETLKCILDKYPEFHSELGALAILKTPMLLMKLRELEFTHKFAATYPILIKAAKYIAEVYNWSMNGLEKNFPNINREVDSDSSSNDGDGEVYRLVPYPRISQGQLANALLLAGSTSTAQTATPGNPIESPPPLPSTSNTTGGQFVTSTALNNALQNAFREATSSAGQAMDSSDSVLPPLQAPTTDRDRSTLPVGLNDQFTSELLVMREMGLLDEARNVQMLILCEGDVARAINLLLSEQN